MLEAAPPLGEAPVVYAWEWELAASPEQLWPLVSDTNRINLLASMAPARFEETPQPEGGVERTGQAKQLGLGVTWDEHPFEWAYPAGFSVRRDFHNGVLLAYRSSVALAPRAGGGTLLAHMVELIPRLGIMAPFVRREGVKLQRNWDHAYRAIDAYLTADGPYPYEHVKAPRLGADAKALAARIAEDSPDPALERRLFDHVLGDPGHEVAHVRPFILADRWKRDREEVLVACVQLVRRALLKPQWSLLCPHCRGAKGTADTIAGLAGKVHCQACNIDFGHTADDKVELTFRPDPRYRRIEEATYCVGGPGATPHVCFQSRLLPGAGRDVGLTVPPGSYRLRGPRIKAPFDFQYHGEGPPLAEGEVAPEPPTILAGPAGAAPEPVEGEEPGPDPRHLTGGKLRLRVVNEDGSPLDVVIETRSWREDVITLDWLRSRPDLLAALGS